MLTLSSLRLMAGIYVDVVIRFPVMSAVGWLRWVMKGSA